MSPLTKSTYLEHALSCYPSGKVDQPLGRSDGGSTALTSLELGHCDAMDCALPSRSGDSKYAEHIPADCLLKGNKQAFRWFNFDEQLIEQNILRLKMSCA
jgi:hypothetical protein